MCGDPPPVALSVVVPARDEAPNLPRLLEEVAAAVVPIGIAWALVVVDDASTDARWSVPQALAATEPRLCPLRLPRPGGQTAALLPACARHAARCSQRSTAICSARPTPC